MLPKSLLLCCRGDWRLCCWKTCLKIRSRSTEPKSLAWANVTGSARTCRKNSQKTLLEFVTAIISSKSLNWFVFFNCNWKISLFFYNCSLTRVHFYLNFIFDTLTREFGWNVFMTPKKFSWASSDARRQPLRLRRPRRQHWRTFCVGGDVSTWRLTASRATPAIWLFVQWQFIVEVIRCLGKIILLFFATCFPNSNLRYLRTFNHHYGQIMC